MAKAKTVLIVEDDPDDEFLALRALGERGIAEQVHVAHGGAEALDYLLGAKGQGKSALPHVVLMDLKMPGVDGLEVLRRIRADEATKGVPVVVFTSSSEQKDILRSYENGANSYVRKPVDYGDFSSALKDLADYWLRLNQTPKA